MEVKLPYRLSIFQFNSFSINKSVFCDRHYLEPFCGHLNYLTWPIKTLNYSIVVKKNKQALELECGKLEFQFFYSLAGNFGQITYCSCFSSPVLIFCSPNHIASYCYYSHGKSFLWIAFRAVFMVCIELELLKKKTPFIFCSSVFIKSNWFSFQVVSFPGFSTCYHLTITK